MLLHLFQLVQHSFKTKIKFTLQKAAATHLLQKTQRTPWWFLKTCSPVVGWSRTFQKRCWRPCRSAAPALRPSSCYNRPSHTPVSEVIQKRKLNKKSMFDDTNNGQYLILYQKPIMAQPAQLTSKMRLNLKSIYSHQYHVDNESGDLKKSSVQGLVGQDSVAETAAAQHQ